jgi:hypothetical protein
MATTNKGRRPFIQPFFDSPLINSEARAQAGNDRFYEDAMRRAESCLLTGPYRPEEQIHPPMGKARHASKCTQ